MKMSSKQRGGRVAGMPFAREFKVAVLLSMGAGVTQAAETTTTAGAGGGSSDIETVVVTGIRAGIEDAIALKRDSSSIVEAISAEDSASFRTPASRNPSRGCRASPRSGPKAAHPRSAFAAPIRGSRLRCSMDANRSAPATIAASNSSSTRPSC